MGESKEEGEGRRGEKGLQAAGKEDRKARESERKPSRCIEKGEGGKEDRKREERHSEKREQ